jgi:hypothetical protein
MTAIKSETLEAATPSESKVSPCKKIDELYQDGTELSSHSAEPLIKQANLYRVPGANGKQMIETFTAREGDGGDYQLVSNTLRRRLSEHTRANPKRSGEALSALALWHYLHEKAGKSGTTYELTQADICFDLGLVTESGAAKAKRLSELVEVLEEIGALKTERATYRTLRGTMAQGGYYYTPSLTVKTKTEAIELGLPEPVSKPSSSKKRVRISSQSSLVDTISTAEGSSPQGTTPTPFKTPTSPSPEEGVTLPGGPLLPRTTRYKKDFFLDSQSEKKERVITEGQINALDTIWTYRLKLDTPTSRRELLEREGITTLSELSQSRANEIIQELNELPKVDHNQSVFEQYLKNHPEEDGWDTDSASNVMEAKGIEPMDYEQAYRPQKVEHRREHSRSESNLAIYESQSFESDEALLEQRRQKAEAFRLMAANAIAAQH